MQAPGYESLVRVDPDESLGVEAVSRPHVPDGGRNRFGWRGNAEEAFQGLRRSGRLGKCSVGRDGGGWKGPR